MKKRIEEIFSENLRAMRKKRGLTQRELATLLNYSEKSVSKWESGASDPSTANLLALAKLFGISAAELLKNVAE